MIEKALPIVEKLESEHSLNVSEYEFLIVNRSVELARILAEKADATRKKVYGNKIFIRGLIEVGNICKNDCLYCGIRRSNRSCDRYRLTAEQILECADEGHALGFRTFVLQGGEGIYSAQYVADTVRSLKSRYPDCAVTLSLGEMSESDYALLREAGADRYLLRHETAESAHYRRLHPAEMSFDNRMRCLRDLKKLGYQVGCGFMVGSPHQTPHNLALDLKFVEEFSPAMCGIGPFIPQKDTPLGCYPAGEADETIYLLSILRLIKPTLLLPATTALGTIAENGRERGIMAGANVIMPNLSPMSERKKYALYDNKLSSGNESAQEIENLRRTMEGIGYEIVTSRGDAL